MYYYIVAYAWIEIISIS